MKQEITACLIIVICAAPRFSRHSNILAIKAGPSISNLMPGHPGTPLSDGYGSRPGSGAVLSAGFYICHKVNLDLAGLFVSVLLSAKNIASGISRVYCRNIVKCSHH